MTPSKFYDKNSGALVKVNTLTTMETGTYADAENISEGEQTIDGCTFTLTLMGTSKDAIAEGYYR